MTNQSSEELDDYLNPGFYVDSDSPEVLEFVRTHMKGDTLREKTVSLFLAVREGFMYDPYSVILKPNEFKASVCIGKSTGFCMTKAIILAAVSRVVGIPARLGFADVKNHLNTKRLRDLMKSDIFRYHGYTELFIDGRWLKVTPTFNRELCEKFGLKPLEFDGTSDCILQPYDIKGNKHMEYVNFHGSFADFPFDMIALGLQHYYPEICPTDGTIIGGDFAQEADEENTL